VHQQQFQLLLVVDQELLEAVWHQVAGLRGEFAQPK
jgi:hypothetical protein